MEILQENQEESTQKINQEINSVFIEADSQENAEIFENARPESVKLGDVLTREEFEGRFFELFDLAGDLAEIPELKINREKNFEVSGAKATANKLYSCAEKYKIMHFLIENGGGWFADAVLIGGFCYAKANVVVYHYSGRGIGSRIMARFKKLPANVQEKAGIFSRFFKKEVVNESEETA